MPFDLGAVETATLVFIGTLVFALVIAVFMMTAAFAAMVLVGAGRLAWLVGATVVLGLVHVINHTWDRLLHHASRVEILGDFSGDFPGDTAVEMMGQTAPATVIYPRVGLRDS